MQLQRRKYILLYVAVYLLVAYSVVDACRTSVSFVQVALKLNQGFNVVVLCVFVVLNSLLAWQWATRRLFGELRLIEQEHVLEKLSFTLLNFVFMASMLNERYLFTLGAYGLLFVYLRVYHWVARDRLELAVQTANDNTRRRDLLRARLPAALAFLGFADISLLVRCLRKSEITKNFFHPPQGFVSSVMAVYLMQALNFATLFLDLLNIFMHATLHFYEFHCARAHVERQEEARRERQISFELHNVDGESEHDNGEDIREDDEDDDDDDEDTQYPGLEGKFMYEKLIDVFTRVLSMIVHVLMLFPFNMHATLIKDVAWDALTLYQSCWSLSKIWRNNKQLDEKLPTATWDDLVANQDDNICIVCMDELIHDGSHNPNHEITNLHKKPKRLPCTHVLHLSCLKNWMERSQTCPICRISVFDEHGNVVQSNTFNRRESTTMREAQNTLISVMEPAVQPEHSVSRNQNLEEYKIRSIEKNEEEETFDFDLPSEGGEVLSLRLHLKKNYETASSGPGMDEIRRVVVPNNSIIRTSSNND